SHFSGKRRMGRCVSCTFCTRNCAVTTTSWSSSSCSAAVAAAVAPAQSTTPRDARTADATDLFLDTMYPTHVVFSIRRVSLRPQTGALYSVEGTTSVLVAAETASQRRT